MERSIKEIRTVYSGLQANSQRRLKGKEQRSKMAQLMRLYFGPAHEIVEALRNEVIADHPAPEGWEGSDLPHYVVEARMREFNALDELLLDVPDIPEKLLITADDFPKEIQGELGDGNQMATAEIERLLWPILKTKPKLETEEETPAADAPTETERAAAVKDQLREQLRAKLGKAKAPALAAVVDA
jgi:hypothetical protein